MKYTKEKIYELLPEIYRQKDAENGYPLKALFDILAEQVEIVQDDIIRLYKNWFIETCDEWVVPYIADLVRTKIPFPVSDATYSQRAWVANTLRYRRRKGTLSMIEQMANDVTGWDAKAVEFFEILITTQYLNHLRPENLSTPDLRDTEKLGRLGTPFNTITHTLDVRHISKRRGLYNIPNIGIFLWRTKALPVNNAPAFDHGDGKFSFNRLGYDEPLYNYPSRKREIGEEKREIDVSSPIRMRALDDSLTDYYYYYYEDIESEQMHGESDSLTKSIKIIVDGNVIPASDIVVCDLSDIKDSDPIVWAHRPEKGKVAIDPTLGRILFPISEMPKKSVHTYHYYGFSSEVGGGFYRRRTLAELDYDGEIAYYYYDIAQSEVKTPRHDAAAPIYKTLREAIAQWNVDGRKSAVFEIFDSEVYQETGIEIVVPANTTLVIRSSQQQQPILLLSEPMQLKGEEGGVAGGGPGSIKGGAKIIFDGLLFNTSSGNSLLFKILEGSLAGLSFHQCTLVPERKKDMPNASTFLFTWQEVIGNVAMIDRLKAFLSTSFSDLLHWVAGPNTKFEMISEDTIKISSDETRSYATITMDSLASNAVLWIYEYLEDVHSILSPRALYKFRVDKPKDGKMDIYSPKLSLLLASHHGNHGLNIFLDDTICGSVSLLQSAEVTVYLNNSILDGKGYEMALDCFKARIENSTIMGQVDVGILEMASNAIFSDKIFVKRLQAGCVRFCYVHEGSRTPRRYHCQPEYFNSAKPPSLLSRLENNDDDDFLNVIPRFVSMTYGDPGYAQIQKRTSSIIFEGADNGSEIGAFNSVYQAQRLKNLREALNEYLRFGMEAGIFLNDHINEKERVESN
jgi:hypothetical protein